jgi:hypothetical protein
MFLSASLGLAAMAGSFIFIEWLNHAVINPGRFAEYAHALIPGVPDERLLYALARFAIPSAWDRCRRPVTCSAMGRLCCDGCNDRLSGN